MANTVESNIADLINQSDDIAKQVHLENWDTVELLTQERQKALEDFFKTPISKKYTQAVEKMIRSILGSDHKLVEFIAAEKKNAFKKYANLQNNNKAKQTYKNVASLDCR